MDKRIIETLPKLYEKAKPYIDYLENLGFYSRNDMKYFNSRDMKHNYEYFNRWYFNNGSYEDYVADLISFTGELKVEVYKFKIVNVHYKKYEMLLSSGKKVYPFQLVNKQTDYDFDCTHVDNLKDFKIEIGKYLRTVKKFKEKIKTYEMESDFK